MRASVCVRKVQKSAHFLTSKGHQKLSVKNDAKNVAKNSSKNQPQKSKEKTLQKTLKKVNKILKRQIYKIY